MKAWIQSSLESRPIQHAITFLVVVCFTFVAFRVGQWSIDTSTNDDALPSAEIPAEADPNPSAAVEYTCPMHPQIRQNQPGECPICFMDLVEVGGNASGASNEYLPLSDEVAALAEVHVMPVERRTLTMEERFTGRLVGMDSSERAITAWTAGRIDRLYVNTIGEDVVYGQPLARVYSPEIALAQETLLHAQASLRAASDAGSEARLRAAEQASTAARQELLLLGMREWQVEDIVESEEASLYVTVYAPASGTVTARHVREGDHVARGAPLLDLSDYDGIWAELDIPERQVAFVAPGASVELTIIGLGETVEGEIAFVEPELNAARRSATARVELDNADGRLRPEMWVDAIVSMPIGEGEAQVVVPRSAVLWTGNRSLVYVYDATENPPVYMPIEVRLGPDVGEWQVIEEGVFPGERIVVNGAFRIDSELQIRGGPTMMHPSSEPIRPSAGEGHHDH